MPTPPHNTATRAAQEHLRSLGIRPVPAPDQLTAPYWEAARRSELRVMACQVCGALRHPPTPTCARCWSSELDWVLLSGHGVVYSYIIDHRLMVPGFDEPYIVAQINPVEAQDDTVRLVANIKDCPLDGIHIGMPVEVFFEQVGESRLPQFRPRLDFAPAADQAAPPTGR